ncbi:MAG: hypothetical protein M4D80_12785 [Myxococcota bacterium]|nr:hypothetical protein [Myxococcota bacterium]
MKIHTLLGTTAVFAAVMMSNDAAADTGCWVRPGTAENCCWEERHAVLGSPTGTSVVQAPSLVTTDGGTVFDVFAQGWDNAVWTRRFDGTTWSDWRTLGGVTTSRPTAVVAAGRVYVFARGGDNAVWYRERIAMDWQPWRTLGGYILGGIGAAAWASGEIEVFAHGGDHALWKNSVIGSTPGGWSSLGGMLFGEPSAGHVTHSGGGESIEVWGMWSDGQIWRRTHDRKPMTIGTHATMLDIWKGWQALLTGAYGGVGLMDEGVLGFNRFALRDAAGGVYGGTANAAGIGALYNIAPITTRSDVSVAPAGPNTEHYAFVDRDTAAVHEFHNEQVCSTCGDGRCYGAESCSTCASDCGACGPSCNNGVCEAGESCSTCASDCGACKPVETCQDYQFCLKADTSPYGGSPITGFGCTIAEARKAAMKKAFGGFPADGPCRPAPSTCGGNPSWVVEWCCKDTGTTYYGVACSKEDADDAAHVDESCDVWSAGICD